MLPPNLACALAKGTVMSSSLSCRRSRRILFLTRFFFLLLLSSSSSSVRRFTPNLFLSCDFFLSFFLLLLLLLLSHNLLLLPHAWSDFDQTWSEWPVGEWLQKLCFVWPQRSCRGHRGQKVIFTENASPPTCFIGFWRNLVRSISG